MPKKSVPTLLAVTLALGACSLAPNYERPEAPVTAAWPAGSAYAPDPAGSPSAAELKWRDFFTDAKLQQLIAFALENNRDLRLAALNVTRAEGMYGIKRGDLFPSASVEGGMTRQRSSAQVLQPGQPRQTTRYNVELGFAGWELDFFGRVRNLSDQALEEFLATDEGRRGAQIALLGQLARTYFTLAADRENLALARSTLEAQRAAYALIEKRFNVGAVSELDLKQARIPVDTARADVARYTQLAAQDLNALVLLAGGPLPADWLPSSLETAGALREVAAGLPSEALLQRPDILAAEHRLKGAYASIGAARAALFPRVTLTGSVGTASTELSRLFEAGTGTWLFSPHVVLLPIFDTRLWAALSVSQADREIALAQYEKAIQTAFREVADALAVRGTIDEQLAAQESLTATVADTYNLARKRYDSGIDSYLTVLDAQRTLFTAQQALVNLRLARLAARIQLYAALGGGAE